MNEPTEKDLKQPGWLGKIQKEVADETLEAELNAVPASSSPRWLRELAAEANGVDLKKPLPDWLTQKDSSPTTAPEPEPQHSDQLDQNEPTA